MKKYQNKHNFINLGKNIDINDGLKWRELL